MSIVRLAALRYPDVVLLRSRLPMHLASHHRYLPFAISYALTAGLWLSGVAHSQLSSAAHLLCRPRWCFWQ